MGHHQKAASCSAIPSFSSLTSASTTTPVKSVKHRSSSSLSIDQQTVLFPLPSFCLYSKKALVNEYAPESDIIKFIAPPSSILEERLPMFVGVLQSLFTVVNDMPFVDKEETDRAKEQEDEYTDIEEEEEEEEEKNMERGQEFSPFTIIGLNSMKLVIWNNMYDHVTDSSVHEKDLCLVIFVSAQLADKEIMENINSLKKSLLKEKIYASFNVRCLLIDLDPF